MKLAQKLVMTPQLQQAIKLLQLSRMELEQTIQQEIMENPVLEDAVGSPEDAGSSESEEGEVKADDRPEVKEEFDLKWEEYYLDEGRSEGWNASGGIPEEGPTIEQTLAKSTSLVDHLLWQLGFSSLSGKEKEIGTLLIGDIDDNGYLRSSLDEIAASLESAHESVEKVLKVVQDFDPSGVGARDLRECLLIQLRQLKLAGTLPDVIVSDYLGDIEKKRYQHIAKECNVPLREVVEACKVVESLEPKPGRPFSSEENHYIVPDIHVVKREGRYVVVMNDDGLPKLKISPYYRSLLRSKDQVADKTKSYLEEKFKSALWLVRSIEQRNRTVRLVAESIVKFQDDFLEKGVNFLRPLILKQVADDISMHESTVSRVTTNKYMFTPQGVYELKFFFNSSLPSTGNGSGSLSSMAVREKIRKMVMEEDSAHPLKDQDILRCLERDGIEIARRTVTKYRAGLKIPPASRRKRLF
ncbi:MAG: RNA polymerase factor sigma-54 [Nitrospiria bacterium]